MTFCHFFVYVELIAYFQFSFNNSKDRTTSNKDHCQYSSINKDKQAYQLVEYY